MEMQARFNFEGRLLATNSEDVEITQNGNKVTVKTVIKILVVYLLFFMRYTKARGE